MKKNLLNVTRMKRETNRTGSSQEDRKNSEAMTNKVYRESISAEEIKELELSWFGGEIVVVDNSSSDNTAEIAKKY